VTQSRGARHLRRRTLEPALEPPGNRQSDVIGYLGRTRRCGILHGQSQGFLHPAEPLHAQCAPFLNSEIFFHQRRLLDEGAAAEKSDGR